MADKVINGGALNQDVPLLFRDLGSGLSYAPVVATVGVSMTGTNVTASSGSVANASAVATLPGVAAKTTYLTGFTMTGGGATAASLVTATVVGTITGTMHFIIAVPAGVTLGITPLVVEFGFAIPASAQNTAIVVTLPALGTGNTNAAATATGYQL